MTVEMQREHQQQRPPQQDQRAGAANRAHAAQQRDAAAAVNTAVAAARVERTRARHLGADKRRLAEGFELLSEQINGRAEMTVLEPGNVLRHGPGSPEAGTANLAAVCEFVARIMRGELPDDALEDMHEARLERHLAGAVQHAQATYQRAHALENAAVSQPALPAGAVQQSSNGAELPRRVPGAAGPKVPIAPAQPPMVPQAPPETPAQSTGKIALGAIEAMLAEGHDMSVSQAALAANGYAGPMLGPSPDPAFGAASIPPQRVGDTQRMDLRELAADSPVEETEDYALPAPRPFPGASIADPGEGSSRSGVDGDDD